ncbi:hypothetical protein Btru_031412 [Bulinus truncatus]|nr:hypothetical protein Btru_031412 [Bulinus truncatus]
MSSYYYKVITPPRPPVMIGARRVGQGQMTEIVSRLYRPSSARSQAVTANNSQLLIRTPPSRGRADFDLERFLRRIQRPTVSHQLSRHDAAAAAVILSDPDSRPSTAPRAPLRRSELEKLLNQLTRPTTASRAKSSVECHLCDEKDRELNKRLVPFEYPYAEDRVVSEEAARSIVRRVSSATKSSEGRGGALPCPRAPPDLDAVRALSSKGLPLISGLPKSKLADVVDRLHPGPGGQGHRSTPQGNAAAQHLRRL